MFNALKTLDELWTKKWETVTVRLSEKGRQTQMALKELAEVKLIHRQEAQRATKAGVAIKESIKRVAAK